MIKTIDNLKPNLIIFEEFIHHLFNKQGCFKSLNNFPFIFPINKLSLQILRKHFESFTLTYNIIIINERQKSNEQSSGQHPNSRCING